MNNPVNEVARAMIEKTSLKATQNRIKIVACLLDKRRFHTINDILNHTAGLNTKSVYNGLKDLVSAGVIDVVNDDSGAQYELSSVHHNTNDIVHLTRGGNVIAHGTISDEVFKQIRLELASQGKTVKTIKVLVEVSNSKN